VVPDDLNKSLGFKPTDGFAHWHPTGVESSRLGVLIDALPRHKGSAEDALAQLRIGKVANCSVADWCRHAITAFLALIRRDQT
jgi:hypothetical protein